MFGRAHGRAHFTSALVTVALCAALMSRTDGVYGAGLDRLRTHARRELQQQQHGVRATAAAVRLDAGGLHTPLVPATSDYWPVQVTCPDLPSESGPEFVKQLMACVNVRTTPYRFSLGFEPSPLPPGFRTPTTGEIADTPQLLTATAQQQPVQVVSPGHHLPGNVDITIHARLTECEKPYGDLVLYDTQQSQAHGALASADDDVWKRFRAFTMSCLFPAYLDPAWAAHLLPERQCPVPPERVSSVQLEDQAAYTRSYMVQHVRGFSARYGLLWVSRTLYGAAIYHAGAHVQGGDNNLRFTNRENTEPGYDAMWAFAAEDQSKPNKQQTALAMMFAANNAIAAWYFAAHPQLLQAGGMLTPGTEEQVLQAKVFLPDLGGSAEARDNGVRVDCAPGWGGGGGRFVFGRTVTNPQWEVPWFFASALQLRLLKLQPHTRLKQFPNSFSFSTDITAAAGCDTKACSFNIQGEGPNKLTYVTTFSAVQYADPKSNAPAALVYVPRTPTIVAHLGHGEHFHGRGKLCGLRDMMFKGVAPNSTPRIADMPWLRYTTYQALRGAQPCESADATKDFIVRLNDQVSARGLVTAVGGTYNDLPNVKFRLQMGDDTKHLPSDNELQLLRPLRVGDHLPRSVEYVPDLVQRGVDGQYVPMLNNAFAPPQSVPLVQQRVPVPIPVQQFVPPPNLLPPSGSSQLGGPVPPVPRNTGAVKKPYRVNGIVQNQQKPEDTSN